MNVMVPYRANAYGLLQPSRTQRQEAAQEVSATLRASIQGKMRAAAKALGIDTQSKAAGGTREVNNELDRDAFLRLLMEQIRNQDPLEPVDNTDMIAQLAQFSSLEQMNNLNARFEEIGDGLGFLNGNIDQLNFISAQGLLGRYVEGVNEAGAPITGTVEAVHLEGSIVVLTVDGERMPMTGVLAVAPTQPGEPVNQGNTEQEGGA